MSFSIKGLGTAVPALSVQQDEAARLGASLMGAEGKRERTLRALFRKSGIRKRHFVVLESPSGGLMDRQSFFHEPRDGSDPGPDTRRRMEEFEEQAPALGVEASASALSRAGVEASEITHLVTVTCTGFFAPGVDLKLIKGLGLPEGVQRINVGFMGCHGSMNGLRVAAALAEADPRARILMTSVELCSLHLAYGWDPDTLVANAIFSDGAAAAVGMKGVGGDSGVDWQVTASGSFVFPDSEEAMTWRIGNHGFRMTLSPRVPDLIRDHLAGWLGEWLRGEGLGLEEVRSWAVHPGGPRILTGVEEALGLDRNENATARAVLADFGNMSSATILFILDRMRKEKAPRPLVALAFGPGLTVEAALLR